MRNIIVKIVVLGMVSLATAMLVLPAAQAEVFGMTANYKYLLGLHRHQNAQGTATDSAGHGVQVDFMWSLDSGDNGGTRIPSSILGFSVAGGALTDHIVTDGARVSDKQGGFYKLSIFYEFVFKNGLGLSAGFGGGHLIGEQEYGALGLTDLGIKYHTKNGLVFSFTTDLMVDPVSFSNSYAQYLDAHPAPGRENDPPSPMFESNYYAFIFGLAAGVGYYF